MPAADPDSRCAARSRASLFSLLLAAASPLIALALIHRLWIRRKGLIGLAAKFSGEPGPVRTGSIIVHGVSLGEVNLMRPLVPKLESAFGAPCLLTTTTETGWQRLGEVFPNHDRAMLPFDLPWAVERFLSRTRPRAVVLLELEVWPQLLLACQRRGIPVALVNARVSARSYAGYRRAGALLRPVFASFAVALAQNAIWGARLRGLGARHVVVSGSMKADMVRPADPDAASALAAGFGLDQRPTLLLASTSPDEEKTVLSAANQVQHWLQRGWRIVICPRHPERGPVLVDLVRELGANAKRTSNGESLATADDLLIVDQIGKLAGLYAWCARTGGIAIVGGSLGSDRGGQNMLEPAAAGACTVVGPDTRNFPDAMALLREAGGVIELGKDAATWQAALRDLAGDDARRLAVGAGGVAAWRAGLGATERVVDKLGQNLSACRTPPGRRP
ncbi:3-deoxy-D-manno-octulosonic acid transferase [Planctomycetota bacterium]|nr:3-deoxy-D-manno-octulosonic acid transferase [Planctomycetota bacterium]